MRIKCRCTDFLCLVALTVSAGRSGRRGSSVQGAEHAARGYCSSGTQRPEYDSVAVKSRERAALSTF